MARRRSRLLPSREHLPTTQSYRPSRRERRTSQKSIAPRFSPRTTRQQRILRTMSRRTRLRRRTLRRTTLLRRTRHRTTYLAPTGRRRTTSQNRNLRLRPSRIVSRQSSQIVGRNQGLRRSLSRIIVRSRQPASARPNNRRADNPPAARPEPNSPPVARPDNQPKPNRNEPAQRPQTPPPSERSQPQQRTPPGDSACGARTATTPATCSANAGI